MTTVEAITLLEETYEIGKLPSNRAYNALALALDALRQQAQEAARMAQADF